ncbi:hypothetical protein [Paraburkholderia diazotrophica]|uniref:Uncharacterized protein n=1 Tax=Paraburkholderia diazotrophica TaxID=667676 RepID=A0A1H6QMD2_9BURK|nr:hypothetical protein [Paraburkholderia diazotrophica]SEI42184.1 hypothetical protein SAMN05192539_1001299 [Paraburkholderia diazotrophica]
MKTTIQANGALLIVPESDLEAYALGKWSKENLVLTGIDDASRPKIMINMTEYPDALGVVLMGGN